jgi:hypothetical protein
MGKSIFLTLVLSGVVISTFLYNPNLNFQGRMLVERLAEKIGSLRQDNEEKRLYDMVLKIPASDIYKNREIYKQLSQLNPSSELYKNKFNYYSGLIDGTKIKSDSRPINRNKNFIDSLISHGAISIDKQLFKIYIDTAFWNTMDYPAKNNFCMTVNDMYTGYFMVDKYSGKTLANSNRLGEINIMQ